MAAEQFVGEFGESARQRRAGPRRPAHAIVAACAPAFVMVVAATTAQTPAIPIC